MGLPETYFVLPEDCTVIVKFCGVARSHTLLKITVETPGLSAGFALCAGALTASNARNSASKMLRGRLMKLPPGISSWWKPYECDRWRWPARRRHPSAAAARKGPGAA